MILRSTLIDGQTVSINLDEEKNELKFEVN